MVDALARQTFREIVQRCVIDHHDVFMVELFGAEASGLTPARVDELAAQGLISTDQLHGLKIPGMENDCDYFEFLIHAHREISSVYDDPAALDRLREESIEIWKKRIDASLTRQRALEAEAEQIGPAQVTVRSPLPPSKKPDLPVTTKKPPVPVKVPPGLTQNEQFGYVQAVQRAGEFARGLGQQAGIDLDNKISEEWDKEQIVQEADSAQRSEMLDVIREEVAKEMIESRDARALAKRLGKRTGLYAHNWMRVARTELQGAYNDAVVLEGIEMFGEECKIARVVESNACKHCIRLFGTSDNPIIFSVQELLENGTNVGVPVSEWKPTIWPVHPNCRCDTRMVPPGMTIRDGWMVLEDEE